LREFALRCSLANRTYGQQPDHCYACHQIPFSTKLWVTISLCSRLILATINLPHLGNYVSLRQLPVKAFFLSAVLLTCFNVVVLAQGKKSVVIGTLIDRPNAILVINPPNGNQGFLLPQLTSAQRLSIAPASPDDNGLLVFDTTDQSFYYWSGGIWIRGLGDKANLLTYDVVTHKLSLGSSAVDLSTLKEIPSISGNAGTFLTTDGTTLSWAKIAALGDITAIITGQGLSGGAASGDISLSVNTDGSTISVNGTNQLQLSDGAVTTAKIQVGAINSAQIADGSVTTADIQDNTIGTFDLADKAVTAAKVQPGAANQVLVTDATGTSTAWVTPGGDISGPVGSTTVTKLQGRDVVNAVPNVGDALIWNGTTWLPSAVASSPVTEFYAIDPSAFIGLEPAGNNDPVTGLFQSDNSFVTALRSAREIIAPVNLPDGATIQNVTAYYMDNEPLGSVTVRFMRKSYTGANEVLSTFTSALVSVVIQNQSLPAIPAASSVVDNSTYTYRIHVIFQPLVEYQTAALSLQRLHGVRVQYTK